MERQGAVFGIILPTNQSDIHKQAPHEAINIVFSNTFISNSVLFGSGEKNSSQPTVQKRMIY
jgi:hypothetical protein